MSFVVSLLYCVCLTYIVWELLLSCYISHFKELSVASSLKWHVVSTMKKQPEITTFFKMWLLCVPLGNEEFEEVLKNSKGISVYPWQPFPAVPQIHVWMGCQKRIEQHGDNSQTRIIKKSKVFYLIAANSGSGLEKKTKKKKTIRAFCKRKQQVDLLAFRPAKNQYPVGQFIVVWQECGLSGPLGNLWTEQICPGKNSQINNACSNGTLQHISDRTFWGRGFLYWKLVSCCFLCASIAIPSDLPTYSLSSTFIHL